MHSKLFKAGRETIISLTYTAIGATSAVGVGVVAPALGLTVGVAAGSIGAIVVPMFAGYMAVDATIKVVNILTDKTNS